MNKPDPQLAGATEAFVHERASATPTRAMLEDIARPSQRSAVLPATLAELQRWFAAAVMDPRGLREGIVGALIDDPNDLERLLTPGSRLSAFQRLGTYAHGYHARLEECLADDYPAVQWALGEDRFHALCQAYVAAHPSRAPSLNFFGRHMPEFLRGYDAPHREFLADLALLEWALVEVLHAAPAPVLSLSELAAVPAESWNDARLPAAETVRLLRFAHPVNAFFQAWRTDQAPEIPGPQPSATAVYRTELTLWRLDLTPPMAQLLEDLFAGKTLGEALGSLEMDAADGEALAEAERNVMGWFREWVAGGVFARIEL